MEISAIDSQYTPYTPPAPNRSENLFSNSIFSLRHPYAFYWFFCCLSILYLPFTFAPATTRATIRKQNRMYRQKSRLYAWIEIETLPSSSLLYRSTTCLSHYDKRNVTRRVYIPCILIVFIMLWIIIENNFPDLIPNNQPANKRNAIGGKIFGQTRLRYFTSAINKIDNPNEMCVWCAIEMSTDALIETTTTTTIKTANRNHEENGKKARLLPFCIRSIFLTFIVCI